MIESKTALQGPVRHRTYDEVGRAVGLGLDRVRDLCREGRRHLKHGMPVKLKISAAQFKEHIHKRHK
jgi:hypothetical protein